MGYMVHHSGLTTNVYHTARLWLSRVYGGLAIASVAGCAVFAAACGSSLATAAIMGRVAIPEMIKRQLRPGTGHRSGGRGRNHRLPHSAQHSAHFIRALTETSIGLLLIAGFIPGIVSALIYMA